MTRIEEKRLKELVSELSTKIKLERMFQGELRGLFGRLAREFRSTFAATGQPSSEGSQRRPIMQTLDNHIRRVQGVASRVDLGLDVFSDQNEADDLIGAALVEWRNGTVENHSAKMASTNVRQMNRSVEVARQEQDGSGIEDRRSLALSAGVILRRMFAGRINTIAATETQEAFESTKQVRAEAVSGIKPFPLVNISPLPQPTPARVPVKQWVDMDDQRVRPTHSAVDGTVLALDGIFEVGSSRLRFPGDTLLFAELKEVINCRCSAVYRND